ncbi:LUD domain-containing protein [Nocardioides jensenii]|uniref:LUD domain-containing protein n=1 Tax=Nocardioides jensenii TaxID=1843 RepID=UPI0008319FBE|nr:LUD domain-containing protein [Nocardioides jensenii]
MAPTERTAVDFALPATNERVERAAAALKAHGFTSEVLENAAAARVRVHELIPDGSRVLTAASETLRLSGIDEDINSGTRYQSVRQQVLALNRSTDAEAIRQLAASPHFVLGSVIAVTETGSVVAASASGSQLPAYAGGARAIWVVGAQKVVPDLETATRRLEEHALPLESSRAQAAYGQASAVNFLLTINADPRPGRATVILLRDAIGF